MGSSFPIFSSHSTPIIFLLIFLPYSISALNITSLLSSYPDLSDFTHLLSSTSIPSDLTHLSSLTLLAVPNHLLRLSLPLLPSSASLPDVLRCHVLLQYLSLPSLRHLPPSGLLITTLFQTTGRAVNTNGAVNLTLSPNTSTVTVNSPNTTIISLIKTIPYNLTIFTVNSLIIPSNLDLTASENRPLTSHNITQILIDARNFNVIAAMLAASGVEEEFEGDEHGAGITVFVPTDEAFARSSETERLQSLPAEEKAVVLKFHVLHSYYPLGSLESIVNPLQPTVATEDSGAGRFTLNITRVNGSVAIDTGIVLASITQTVFDQNPVSIFAVSRVLLPKEVFGKRGEVGGEATAPEIGVAPENSVAGSEIPPPTRIVAPPGFGEIGSSGGDGMVGRKRRGGFIAGFLFCIGLYLMV